MAFQEKEKKFFFFFNLAPPTPFFFFFIPRPSSFCLSLTSTGRSNQSSAFRIELSPTTTQRNRGKLIHASIADRMHKHIHKHTQKKKSRRQPHQH